MRKQRPPVKDGRYSRMVIALASIPPISRDGKWCDGIPERESPDGPPPPENTEPYPFDGIVAGTLRLRAGRLKQTMGGIHMIGKANRQHMVNLYKRRGNRYHVARELRQ